MFCGNWKCINGARVGRPKILVVDTGERRRITSQTQTHLWYQEPKINKKKAKTKSFNKRGRRCEIRENPVRAVEANAGLPPDGLDGFARWIVDCHNNLPKQFSFFLFPILWGFPKNCLISAGRKYLLLTFPLWENYDCENCLISRLWESPHSRLAGWGQTGLLGAPPNTPRVPHLPQATSPAQICYTQKYYFETFDILWERESDIPSLLPMLMILVIVTSDDEDDNNNNNNHGCCRCKCTIGRLCWKVLTSSLCYITQYYTNTPPLLQTSNSNVTLL